MAAVLIIEDQQELREIYRLMLAQMGHQVAVAPTGVEGLHQLKNHPDLVILDLSMPMASGDVVLGFIRSTPELAGTRVLVVSAHPNAETLAEQLGADACLRKPVEFQEMAKTVNALLQPGEA